MKADRIIEKFGLRQIRNIRGTAGQKMDEDCIQKFVDGDPSGTCKYLEWMFYQAGGGGEKLTRSIRQWEDGEHGEPPLKVQLRDHFVKMRMKPWLDDDGKTVAPVSRDEAARTWEAEEDGLKWFNIYGDEEYAEQGCFGFYQHWPGANDYYCMIVDAVKRFHRHAAALRSKGHSTDLSLKNYPQIVDLMEALKDVTLAELKADVNYDLVYTDDWLQVYCPLNVGASLKFGHTKWCTSNESMLVQAVAGVGKNRWREYASTSALYYCHFRNIPDRIETPVKHVAVQVVFPHDDKGAAIPACLKPSLDVRAHVAYAKFWDTEDKSNTMANFLDELGKCVYIQKDHIVSFQCAINAIVEHFRALDPKSLEVNLVP